MAGFLDDQELTINCPRCGYKTKKSIGWIKSNNQLTCICFTILNLKTEEFKRQLASTEASFDRLKKTLKDINQRQ